MEAERADVTVRFWAGARAAAGVDQLRLGAATVAELCDHLRAQSPALAQVLEVASVLVDGHASRPETRLVDGQVVEVLPPFAGG